MSFKSGEPASNRSVSPSATVEERSRERDFLVFKPAETVDLSEAFFVSASYDGGRRAAFVKLYEPESKKIYFWYDNTGHKPYCLSDLPVEELRKIEPLVKHQGFDHLEEVTKVDSLRDKVLNMTKIVATDPLAIGGRPAGSIRDIIPKAWEADIRYYECFVYDRGLFPGMPYRVEGGSLVPVKPKLSEGVSKRLSEALASEPEEFGEFIRSLTDLFECRIPEFRRVALDIEVASDVPTRVPDPEGAEYPVVCATLLGSDGVRRILLLRREGVDSGPGFPEGVKVEFCDREVDLITEIFKALLDYPVVLTFNGDEFDLRYLYHRAEKRFKFAREQIPIELGKQFALLKYGVHIDLYKFFFNRSLQIYAFSQRYRENTLDAVGEALIGKAKIEFEGSLNDLAYSELAEYCYRDAEIAMELTTFDNDLVMKLILILTRISRMPMDDVCRQGVSSWIRSLMYYEHRLRNYLIPRSEDLLELKGMTSTEALIKGKKYKGAIVVEPRAGVHFNVSVLDFASLYPSIIKMYNLSYETVLCPHSDCRDNKVPDLPYWICKRRRGLSSLIIGAMRDLRVDWYKRVARDKSLPEPLRNLYNVVQLTLKVILNASYGVMGAEAFALYCPPVAEAVTAIGRYAFTKTIEKARSLGIEVVYGDTDSIFLEAPTAEQVDELVNWSREELRMELEIDKSYRYAAFPKLKKNYLGVYPDGTVDIKGMTGKKRNTPAFLQAAFMEMVRTLGEVQSPDDFEKARARIFDVVKTCYVKLKRREYPLEDLAFNIMISKPVEGYRKTTPQHVKAALLLQKSGIEVKPGDVISFVKVTSDLGVKPVRLTSSREVDVSKYMEYVQSTFEQVLDALGIDFKDIMGVTKLESFFGAG